VKKCGKVNIGGRSILSEHAYSKSSSPPPDRRFRYLWPRTADRTTSSRNQTALGGGPGNRRVYAPLSRPALILGPSPRCKGAGLASPLLPALLDIACRRLRWFAANHKSIPAGPRASGSGLSRGRHDHTQGQRPSAWAMHRALIPASFPRAPYRPPSPLVLMLNTYRGWESRRFETRRPRPARAGRCVSARHARFASSTVDGQPDETFPGTRPSSTSSGSAPRRQFHHGFALALTALPGAGLSVPDHMKQKEGGGEEERGGGRGGGSGEGSEMW